MKTHRKGLIAVLLLTFLIPHAFAELIDGTTVAGQTTAVVSQAGGLLEDWSLTEGMVVSKGEHLGATNPNRVYAEQDGTVAILNAQSGDRGSGTVLVLQPTSLFTVYCTVSEAYEKADNQYVHSGEAVWLKCSVDGTHRGTGIITQIDNDTYTVEATGGTFLVGETVYIYRDEEFSKKQKIGIGTVVTSDTQAYRVSGNIIDVCVEEGEEVERGELLFTWASADTTEITAPTGGIVTEVTAQTGAELAENQIVAQIASFDDICIECKIKEEELADLLKCETVSYYCANDDTETAGTAHLDSISTVDENGDITVRYVTEEPLNRLGLTLSVFLPGLED